MANGEMLVLCASRYSFEDENQKGRMVEACKVTYADMDERNDGSDKLGVPCVEIRGTYGLYEQLAASPVPGIYKLNMRIVPWKGKPLAELAGLEYVRPAHLAPSATENAGKRAPNAAAS